jgi:Flp pilus assembly protein TadG
MQPPFIQRRTKAADRHQERGVTMVLVALAIFSIIAIAALSIDVGTLFQASAEAQRAADAGALAAARVISMSGLTGTTNTTAWEAVCGGTNNPATTVATTVAQQNSIAGISLPSASVTVTVTYGAGVNGGAQADCSTAGTAFQINPTVTVKVQRTNLPVFFARVFSLIAGTNYSSISASASATSEALNPSASDTVAGGVVPVQPRCVKPWFVPNSDPLNPPPTPYCTGSACNSFVSTADGTITNPGILADGSGVIGETFTLVPDCVPGGTCALRNPPPQANVTYGTRFRRQIPPNLEYLPGLTSYSSAAVPSDGTDACTNVAGAGDYAQAIAGCDQSTQYQCGKPVTSADLNFNENPGTADTTNGVECLIHQAAGRGGTGQDTLVSNGNPALPDYPFRIQIGSSNPLLGAGAGSTDLISSSNSIVSLPIYDSNPPDAAGQNVGQTGPYNVTVIGFLQVFINRVDDFGDVNVTVLNVAGCGNAAPNTPLYGSSPVPVRLITPP